MIPSIQKAHGCIFFLFNDNIKAQAAQPAISNRLELRSSEPLTLDEEVRIQEEWHRNKRKCTFIIIVHNLLLLHLNIVNNDWPSVAAKSSSHIPLP